GSVWTERQPAQSPSPRLGHQMAYDAARHRTILFGGRDRLGAEFRDTWSYDGTTWTLLADSTPTRAAVAVGMAYHAAAGGIVRLGGEATSAASASAGAASGESASAAPASGGAASEAASGGAASDETWFLSSGGWEKLTPEVSPPGRSMFGMAFDAVH